MYMVAPDDEASFAHHLLVCCTRRLLRSLSAIVRQLLHLCVLVHMWQERFLVSGKQPTTRGRSAVTPFMLQEQRSDRCVVFD